MENLQLDVRGILCKGVSILGSEFRLFKEEVLFLIDFITEDAGDIGDKLIALFLVANLTPKKIGKKHLNTIHDHLIHIANNDQRKHYLDFLRNVNVLA